MSVPSWFSTRWWIFVVVGSLLLAGWGHSLRIGHVLHVSNLARGDEIQTDANSPTGYEMGMRRLIVPQRNVDSFQWIMQAQSMLAEKKWRLRHVDYDNAPEGRSVLTASAYRWWLSGIAWIDHKVLGTPLGVSVERSALVADPLAQLLMLALTAVFLARYLGGASAALFCFGAVAFFPLGGAFAPGQPGQSTLLLTCAVWSVAPLVAGLRVMARDSSKATRQTRRRLFFTGGVFGGVGLWIGVVGAAPLLVGILVAGVVSELVSSRKAMPLQLPWRAWAIGGAVASFVLWLVDRSPALLESAAWRSDFVHPLYSLAWLGCGEFLVLASSRGKRLTRRGVVTLSLAGMAVCGLLYMIFFHGGGAALAVDPVDARLTRLPVDPGVTRLGDWVDQANWFTLFLATLLPASLIVAGAIAMARVRQSSVEMALLAIVLGPALLVLCLAPFQLGWWSYLDALVLVLASAAISMGGLGKVVRRCFAGTVIVAALVGAVFVFSGLDRETRQSVDHAELTTLMERYLAQWLARRMEEPGAVVLAPPVVTASLTFYADLRGLGTPYPGNEAGFAAAARLSAATTPDEARAVAVAREVALIVHPSWDRFLEEYARIGTNQPENSFIALLNRWFPPRWLQPVPLRLPSVEGFEDESVAIFRVVEVQDNASALGRLVEYFIDSGHGQQAIMVQQALSNGFPGELVTSLTEAEVALAIGDRAMTRDAVESILESIEKGAADYMDWDFRVRLSLVLAGAKQIEESKSLLERCLEEADKDRISRLPAGALVGMLHLTKALGLEFDDPSLYRFAVSLLPKSQQSDL